MTEQGWTPLFRTAESTVTKVLKSPAFMDSRGRARVIIDDPIALKMLANSVERVDRNNAALSAIADRVAAAVGFLRAKADQLDTVAESSSDAGPSTVADTAARERLLVAALDYLITPVDLVPDFHAGGYIDDMLLLSWVFGAAANELEPFMDT